MVRPPIRLILFLHNLRSDTRSVYCLAVPFSILHKKPLLLTYSQSDPLLLYHLLRSKIWLLNLTTFYAENKNKVKEKCL